MSKFNQGNSKASKLTGVEVMEIREKYASGLYTYDRLSREYFVATNTIRSIVKGTSWQQLPSVTPQEVVEEGAVRSMRRLNELMKEDRLPPAVVLDDEALAAMQAAIAKMPEKVEFERPSAEMLKRMAGYGARLPQPTPLRVSETSEVSSVDEDGSEEGPAHGG